MTTTEPAAGPPPHDDRLLDAGFPFHLRVDARLRVVAAGRSLPRLCPGLTLGDDVNRHLVHCAPSGPVTAGRLDVPSSRAVILRTVGTEVMLRCQVLPEPDGGRLLLATPWLTGSDAMARSGLTVADFAPHDPSPDFAFVSQGQLTALDDVRRLADRLREMESQRRHQALHDALTGVGNRRRFAEQLRSAPDGTAMVLVDVDGFKEVNDTFGHPVGDAVLCAVAERIGALTEPSDTVCRLAGDEFAVLVGGPTAAVRSTAVATGIVQAMRSPVVLGTRRVTVTISVGVVPHEPPDTLVRNADVALYAAKRGGRGQVVVFDAALHQSLLYRTELRDRLGGAVEQGAISLAYQPIVELATGRVHGFEALARWTDPVLGQIPPDVFIALAEEAGLIAELGLFVLETGARQLGDWRREFPDTDLNMSVNLAPRQLEDPELAQRVADVLAAHALPPHSLQLELTESAFTSHSRSTEQLHRLRDLGLPLAIDDFGSSESTLARLHTVPATTLKIDRAFLKELDTAPERSTRLLQAVTAIADALGLDTVAEGIETVEHRDVVAGVGCTYGQGYLYARPMGAVAAGEYLARELAVDRPRDPARVPQPRPASDPADRGADRPADRMVP
jgi:diguanylate cyclase (GGDEF)-like protein